MIITSLKCLQKGHLVGRKIGNPEKIPLEANGTPAKASVNRQSNQSSVAASPAGPQGRPSNPGASPARGRPSNRPDDIPTIPIDVLNPFLGGATIKGRVTNKYEIKTWNKVSYR